MALPFSLWQMEDLLETFRDLKTKGRSNALGVSYCVAVRRKQFLRRLALASRRFWTNVIV